MNTDAQVRNAKPGEHAIQGSPGLRLIVSEHGTRSWQYRFKSPITGKLRRYHFATYPAVSLADARHLWSDLKRLRDGGLDPLIERDKARAEALAEHQASSQQAARDALTVAHVARLYLDAISNTHRSWKQGEGYLRRGVLPEIGNLPLLDVKPSDCKRAFQQIAIKSPTNANRTKSWASSMWNWASDQGWPELDDLLNPWLAVRNAPEKTRDRVLSEHELRKLLSWDGGKMGAQSFDALRLALLTGLRIGEVVRLNAAWLGADDSGDFFEVPAEFAKNGKPHKVYLTWQMAEIVHRADARRPSSGFVFASERRDHIGYNAPGDDLRRHGGLPGVAKFTPHDLRRTMATWLSGQEGLDERIIARMLNHTLKGVTAKHYALHRRDPQAARMWQAWNDYLTGLTEPNVIQFNKEKHA